MQVVENCDAVQQLGNCEKLQGLTVGDMLSWKAFQMLSKISLFLKVSSKSHNKDIFLAI